MFSLHCTVVLEAFSFIDKVKKKIKTYLNLHRCLLISYLFSLDTIMRWQRARFMVAVNTIFQHVKAKTIWALVPAMNQWFFRQTFGVVSLLDKALNKTSVIKLWLKGSMFYCICLRFKPTLGASLYIQMDIEVYNYFQNDAFARKKVANVINL